MKYITQALIGVCGIIFCALVLLLSYAFFTDVSWIIPAFTIPFMGGFCILFLCKYQRKTSEKSRKRSRKEKEI